MIFNHLLSIHCCALFFILLKICLPPIHIVVPFCDLTRKNAWKFVLVVLVKPPICDFGITPRPGERGLSQSQLLVKIKAWFSLFTWFTLLTWFKLLIRLTLLTLFTIFKLLYTACLVACMPTYIERLEHYWNGLRRF